MPFLRRNLSYIRDYPRDPENSIAEAEAKPIKNDLHQTYLTQRIKLAPQLVSENSYLSTTSMSYSTHIHDKQNNLQQNTPSYSDKEMDESEIVDVTMMSCSDDSLDKNPKDHKIIVTNSPNTPNETKLEHILSNIKHNQIDYDSKQSSVSESLSRENKSQPPSYDPITIGPPTEFKSSFALFSKFNREIARQLVAIEKQRNKEEIRKMLLRMWSKSTQSDIEFWIQQYERDRQRFHLQRKMYFYSLSRSNVTSRKRKCYKKANSPSSSTHNGSYSRIEKSNKEKKTVFYYKYMDKNMPVIHTEMRKDFNCPFCSFRSNSHRGQVIHLETFHNELVFECGYDEEKNLHVSVARNHERYRNKNSHTKCEHLNNFGCVRETTTDGCIEESRNGPLEISHVKRSQKLAANMDLITRRKKIRLLKGSNADDETVSRFTRSTRMPLRQYFHSRSNLAMNKDDWDIDSDEESDDEWLRQHRRELTNDFEDVSEKEKQFMICWNEYMQSHVTIPDKALPQKCAEFIQHFGKKLIEEGFQKHLLVHLLNLWDNKLISSLNIFHYMHNLNSLHKKSTKE